MMAQDELMQSPDVRLARLEQENARLRAELEAYKGNNTRRTQRLPLHDRGPEQAAFALLQAEVAAYKRQAQAWQAELRAAHDRAKAAQERAIELAKANDVLRDVNERLANQPTLEAFVQHVLATACNHIGQADGALFRYDQTANVLRLIGGYVDGQFAPTLPNYPYDADHPLPIANLPTWEALVANRQTMQMGLDGDLAVNTTEWHRAQQHMGVLVTPLLLGDRVVGMMGLAFKHKHNFSGSELELYQALGQQAALAIQVMQLAETAKQAALAKQDIVLRQHQEWAALKRAAELEQANAALAVSERRFRELFEYMVDAAVIHDTDGRILEANYENVNLLGYTRDEMVQLNCADLDPWVQAHYDDMKQCWASLRPGDVTTLTSTHRHKNGALVPVWVRVSTFEWDGQRRFLAAARDMSKLVEAETNLREEVAQRRQAEAIMRRQNHALTRSLELLLQQPDTCGFLRALVKALVSELDGIAGSLWLLDRDGDQVQLAIAHTSNTAQGVAIKLRMPNHPTLVPLIANMLRTNQPGWRETIYYTNEDDRLPPELRQMQHQNGIKVVFTTPVRLGDQTLGWLNVVSDQDLQCFTRDKVAFLEATASQAAIAIHLDRLAEQAKQTAIVRAQKRAAQQQAAELARANEELRHRDRLLSVVAQVTKNLLEADDIDVSIPAALRAVGEVAAMSRVLLLLVESQEPATATLCQRIIYEWTAEGICDNRSLGLHTTDSTHFEGMFQLLCQGKALWCSVADLPPVTRAYLEKLDVKSTGVVPIFMEGRYLGCVAFDDCVQRRQWSQHEIDVLTTAAESIGATLYRKQLVDRLIAERLRTEQERAAELAKANALLRKSLSRLSTNRDLKAMLGHLLVELALYAGAPVAHIFQYNAAPQALTLTVRVENGQAFWTPSDTEPSIFRSPISITQTPVFNTLCQKPKLLSLNQDQFPGRIHPAVLEWFSAKGYQATSCCVLMVGDRPLGMLAMAFAHPVALRPVDEELVLALAQQIALVMQLTSLVEADKQAMLAHEREIAAQARASELAKATQSLQRSLNRLADDADLDSFLGHILVEITAQIGADTGHIFLYDPETNLLKLRQGVLHGQPYQTAIAQDAELFHAPFPADLSPAFDYMCQQRTITLHDRESLGELAWKGVPDWLRQHDYQHIASLALIAGNRPIGILGVAFRHKPSLQPEECGLIHALAHQATLAIQLTQLAEQAKEAAIFEERNRLAGEIHDTLAQAFTGISMQLGVAKWLVQQDPVAVEQILDRVNELAQTGLAEARRSVWTLYPADEAYADLASQLSRCVVQMTGGTSIQANVQIVGTPCALSPMLGKNLLRIGQEAITNALKHAQASTLEILLTYTEQSIRLCIHDDGCGFSPNVEQSGFGLLSMADRADRMGGQLTISSQLGHGTAICIQVPLK